MKYPDYPISNKEKERLAVLENLDILDSLQEDSYDFITKMAQQVFDVPIALISFVDRDRQWFKSRIGLEATSTPRDEAFCAHTIMDDEVLIVENAMEDERFKDNPLVLDDPNIVFYAGSPIVFGDEIRLGSVCIIDRKPRSLTEEQKELLKSMSSQVSTLLEMRSAQKALRESLDRIKKLEHLIPICSWCKNIRDQQGSWQDVEKYLNHRDNTIFTHAICPSCSDMVISEGDSSSADV